MKYYKVENVESAGYSNAVSRHRASVDIIETQCVKHETEGYVNVFLVVPDTGELGILVANKDGTLGMHRNAPK